jgi:hypothetical protein
MGLIYDDPAWRLTLTRLTAEESEGPACLDDVGHSSDILLVQFRGDCGA